MTLSRALVAAGLPLSIAAITLTSPQAQAVDGTYGAGVVSVAPSAGQTDLRLVIGAYDFGDGPDFYVDDFSGTPVNVTGCGGIDEFGDFICRDTAVTGVRVDAGDTTGYVDVSIDTDTSPDITILASTRGGSVTAGGTGASVDVVGNGGRDDVSIYDDSTGTVSVSGGGGRDSIDYTPSGPATSFDTDLGPGDDDGFVGGRIADVRVVLGSGNDTFTSVGTSSAPIVIEGGSGNDRIHAMRGRVRVNGGGGNDVVQPDKNPVPPLSGGIPADPNAGDVVRGGAGTDTLRLDSVGRVEPVRISLDGKADDGQRNEKDDYGKDLENVYVRYVSAQVSGTRGANVITLVDGGTARGLQGRDTLRGGTKLIGGPGRDRLLGGGETRVIKARDGERDVITCSRSAPTVVLADKSDVVQGRGCAKVVRR